MDACPPPIVGHQSFVTAREVRLALPPRGRNDRGGISQDGKQLLNMIWSWMHGYHRLPQRRDRSAALAGIPNILEEFTEAMFPKRCGGWAVRDSLARHAPKVREN